MTLVEMECPNCGAKVEVNTYISYAYECKFCGTKFVHEKITREAYAREHSYEVELSNLENDRKYKNINEFHHNAFLFTKKYPKSADGLYYYILASIDYFKEYARYENRFTNDSIDKAYEDYLKLETDEARKKELMDLFSDFNDKRESIIVKAKLKQQEEAIEEKERVQKRNRDSNINAIKWSLIVIAVTAFITFLFCIPYL